MTTKKTKVKNAAWYISLDRCNIKNDAQMNINGSGPEASIHYRRSLPVQPFLIYGSVSHKTWIYK